VANNDDPRFPNWPETMAEWNEMRRDLPPPTDDDVGIRLRDGRHLKTRSDLIAHFGEDFILDDNPTQADDDTRYRADRTSA
jgi:hypothetical protein